MNLVKSYEFFKPENVAGAVQIVGCGSVGSALAELLARCGVKQFFLYDFDVVEEKNIVNQMYTAADVGRPKVDALKDILKAINPDADITVFPNGWNGQALSGYVFLAVDNIELRRELIEKNLRNIHIKAVFDFRTMLTAAQSFAADWSERKNRENLLRTMQYTHEDALKDTPVSACGETLGVASTVRLITAFGVNNFINFVKGEGLRSFIETDGFDFRLDAFK